MAQKISKNNWQITYPAEVVETVNDLFENYSKHQNSNIGAKSGMISFLIWLANNRQSQDVGLIYSTFTKEQSKNIEASLADERKHNHLFCGVMNKWSKAIINNQDPFIEKGAVSSSGTKYSRVYHACGALIFLRDRSLLNCIPKLFKSSYIEKPKINPSELSETNKTLGESDWPELDGLSGFERDRKALKLVRDECVKLFLYYEKLHKFGQILLNNNPLGPENDPESCEKIKIGLLEYRNAIKQTGNFEIPGHFQQNKMCRDEETWLKASGIDISQIWIHNQRFVLAHRCAFGPALPATYAAFTILLCDTGWNVQPARDLPRYPYAFRSSKHTMLASRSIITAFKRRAGHLVVGYLGERNNLTETQSEVAMNVLNETISAFETDQDQYDCNNLNSLKTSWNPTISAAEIIERYRIMAETMRTEFGDYSEELFSDDLWIYTSRTSNPKPIDKDKPLARHSFDNSNLFIARKGFNHKAIRKSVLNLTNRETGSFAETQALAGHAGSGVLMPHYLNNPTVIADLDNNIRLFQDAMEGIITRDLDQDDVAEKLGKTVTDLNRMRDIARRAGISAALGLITRTDDGSTENIHFTPTEENLTMLYLVHRKLRQMQTDYPNKARYRLDYLPLLALVKAIGYHLFAQQYKSSYKNAAYKAAGALRSGEITLPMLED